MPQSLLGKGVYAYPEAARLLKISPQRARAWFLGRATGRGPVLKSDYAVRGAPADVISFLDLIEALVASRLREHQVSLIAIRSAHRQLGRLLKTGHPFSHSRLYTDGQTVFVRLAEESGDESLIEAIRQQRVFPRVILPYLKRIDYSHDTQLAQRWRIMDGVIVDPARRFGKPIVDASGMPTSILAAAYIANRERTELVADWYAVSPKDVELAVEFEERFRRKAA